LADAGQTKQEKKAPKRKEKIASVFIDFNKDNEFV